MKIFATLTSEDLLELNINAFGARKLLLLAIKQLKSETRPSDDWIKLSDFKDIHALLEHLNMKDYTSKLPWLTFIIQPFQIIPKLNIENFFSASIRKLFNA